MGKNEISNLSIDGAREELEFLKRELKRHDDLYYNKSNPEITDAEYDELRNRLNEIEKAFPSLKSTDSPSQKVGATVNSQFSKITHKTPMLSLDNALSEDDMKEFITRIKKFLNISDNHVLEFCAEQKIDGLSAAILYRDGKLIYGATRGDGYVGEDITENLKTIDNIPQTIGYNGEIEIRGEVYMPIDSFRELNETRELNAEPLFANPRNAAAGSLRQLNPEVTRERNLKFFAYYIKFHDQASNKIEKQTEVIEILRNLGFSTAEYCVCNNIEDIMFYYNKIYNNRDSLNYDIDGTVFKVNSLALQERLGFVGRAPRHSIAFKFPPEIAETKLLDIIVSVGRTGKITPVALVEPVKLMGATISKATLHNFEEIERKSIAIGDTVRILRSGDVIPKIIGVVKKSQNQNFQAPNRCPSCGSELVKYPELIDLYCPNHYSCPEQVTNYISYFVSKNCFDIVGLGSKQVTEFFKEGRIKKAIDIFKLEELDKLSPLENKPGWGKVSALKLYKAINDRKSVQLDRFITSLGIPGVGEIIAKLLADKFENLDNLLKTKEEELLGIEGLGELLAEKIYSFLRNSVNLDFINELREYVTINYTNLERNLDINNKFYKKILVFTGTLQHMSRDEAKKLAISKGAKIASAISKNTNFVIAGEKAGSKLTKAQELNVPVLSEEEFLDNIR